MEDRSISALHSRLDRSVLYHPFSGATKSPPNGVVPLPIAHCRLSIAALFAWPAFQRALTDKPASAALWLIGLTALLTALAGCHTAPPAAQYPHANERTILDTIRARYQSIDRLQARGTFIVRKPDGETVRLNGVLVAERTGRFRAQGWKLNHKVFDLTRRGEKTWLWLTDRIDKEAGSPLMPGLGDPAGLAWFAHLAAMPREVERINRPAKHTDRKHLTVRWPLAERPGWHIEADIERATRTIRRLRLIGDTAGDTGPMRGHVQGTVRGCIRLSEHRTIDERSLPTRITFADGAGENRFTLVMEDLTLNPDLPANAFEPPAEARRLDLNRNRTGD